MSGIRVDTEWLAQYSGDLRAAGQEVADAQRVINGAELAPEAFGEVGRSVGAGQSYSRVTAVLAERSGRMAEALIAAGDELRAVVDFHTGGDDDNARDLARKQES